MKNSTKYLPLSFGILLGFLLALVPSVAQANAGVPMIFLIFPPSLFAIIPIIIIEGFVYTKLLGLNYSKAFLCSICANLISTLVGFPLLWMTLVGVAMPFFSLSFLKSEVRNWLLAVILFPTWLPSFSNKQLLYLVPLSATLFLIIAYFVSVLVEKIIIALLLKKKTLNQPIDNKYLIKCVWIANLFTYIPLVISVAFYLYFRGLQYVT